MTKNFFRKFSIVLGLCTILLGINPYIGVAQPDVKSTFELGKVKEQKNPIPGEGSLKGKVVVLGKKDKIPLAFIVVERGRSIQADQKGKFDLVIDEAIHKITISCSGYKDLIIESIAVLAGKDQYIVIELAEREKGGFK